MNKGELFTQVTEGDMVTIIAAEEIELSDYSRSDKKTVAVQADIVTVRSPAVFTGTTLQILCRRLVFSDAGAIVTSGKDGTPDFPIGAKAAIGANLGDKGVDGAGGGKGQRAGDVTICAGSIEGPAVITARGGKGGRGQDGGDGNRGLPGRDSEASCGHPDDGQQGHPGGQRGAGGPSQPGETGGNLSIESPTMVEVKKDLDGGEGGGATKPGERGKGGQGGGSRTYKCCTPDLPRGPKGFAANCLDVVVRRDENGLYTFAATTKLSENGNNEAGWEPFGAIFPEQALLWNHVVAQANLLPLRDDECTTHVSKSGETGPDGLDNTFDPGQPRGNNGEYRYQQKAPAEFSLHAAPAYGAALLTRAEQLYLSDETDSLGGAIAILNWLIALSGNSPTPAAQSTADASILSASITRAKVLLTQISCGLDYFGNARNYVPIISPAEYAKVIAEQLLAAQVVEAAYNTFFSEQADIEKKRSSVSSALDAFDKYAAQSSNALRELQLLEDAARSAIAALLNDLHNTIVELHRAEDEFKTAVARSHKCTFEEIVKLGTTIYAAASGAWPALLSLAGKLDAVGTDISKGDWGDIVKHVEVIGKNVKTIEEAYDKIKDAIDDATKTDSVKIVQSKDEFDEMIRKYIDLPEAKKYKEVMYHFFEIVQARNNKVLEYSALNLRYLETFAKKEQLRVQLEVVRSQFADSKDPDVARRWAFMSQAYHDVRRDVARLVYEEHRAVEYWALTNSDVSIHAQTVAELVETHRDIGLEKFNVQKAIHAVENSFLKWQVVDIRPLITAGAFDSFKKTGVLSFTIRRESFKEIAAFNAVRLTEAQVIIEGAKSAKFVVWRLTHWGLSTYYRADGKVMLFSHNSLNVSGKYHLTAEGEPDTTSKFVLADGTLAAPSPFAAWTLAILNLENDGMLSLKDVSGIKLGIKGTFS